MLNQFFIVFLLFGSTVGFFVLFYLVGTLMAHFHHIKKQSEIASLAALHALISSEGLHKSTVIQRIVEKYNVIPENSEISEEVKKLEEQFAATIAGPKTEKEKKKEREIKAKSELFFAPPINPRDTV